MISLLPPVAKAPAGDRKLVGREEEAKKIKEQKSNERKRWLAVAMTEATSFGSPDPAITQAGILSFPFHKH